MLVSQGTVSATLLRALLQRTFYSVVSRCQLHCLSSSCTSIVLLMRSTPFTAEPNCDCINTDRKARFIALTVCRTNPKKITKQLATWTKPLPKALLLLQNDPTYCKTVTTFHALQFVLLPMPMHVCLTNVRGLALLHYGLV